ncbi:MAG: branched-chain amino acid ABC transporter permease [Actinobacteria bacterium]|jgi:branched-chain amino acid transport system permease protein|nr:branched-chain amino acid ABC transporter permease [Actinomycetota bacterium]
MDWLNAAVQGILLGGLYALFAVGLSLVFGTMRLVNLAHGDLTIIPAYVALVIVGVAKFNAFYSIPIVMVIMFIVGYLLQRGVLNFVVVRGDIAGVIVTFGLSIVIANALQEGFTANSQGLDAGKIENLSITINERLAIGWLPLLIFVMALVVITLLQLFMNRTKMGRAFRAVSDDQEAARLMGINTRHIWAVAMGVALLIVSIGGVMMGIRTTFHPLLGADRLIFAFEAVIIGGMGSSWGTLLGGVILGMAQTLGARAFGSAWQILVGHVVFIIILALRPQGFLAKTVTA